MIHLLYTAVASVCAGVVLVFVCGVGLLWAGIVVGMAALAAVFGTVFRNQKLFVASIICAALALGVVRADLFIASQEQETLTRSVGQAEVVGKVLNDPDRRERSLRLVVSVESVNNTPAQGTLLVLADRDTQVVYGDSIHAIGKITVPEAFETDTGHLFDYPNYLHVQGVSAQMSYAKVEVLGQARWSLLGVLFSIKHAFEDSLGRLLPEPEGALMVGMLLGEKQSIPKEVTDAFVASGLIHVVVLSGYNIAIVADAVFRVLAPLPRGVQFGVGSVLMIFFALMAGTGAATVRALIMALIALLARYYNRSALALRALAVAVAVMVLWNPYILLHDPSFILSVLATFGLITLSPWVEQWLPKFLPRFPSVRSIAASTIAVQLFLLPALLYFSGIVSFFALPANMLVLPLVPTTMLLGFVAGLLGLLSPLFGFVPALCAELLLSWALWVAATTAHLPFSVAIVPEFSGWLLCAVYMPLGWFAIRKYQQTASPEQTN